MNKETLQEEAQRIKNETAYETPCSNPKFEEEEKPITGKRVKIRLANNQIVEGFLEE